MDFGKIVKGLNDVSAINNALGGKDNDLTKIADAVNGISDISKALDGGIDLKQVAANIVVDKVAEQIADNKVVKVISGFPGIGKSWLSDNQNDLGVKVSDSDSSKFSWISEGVRHPDFPGNYIEHIKEQMATSDVVLVSSHDVVRDALTKAGIEFLTVYPNINDKEEYIKRFIERGSKEAFVKLLNDNWDQWVGNLNKNNSDLHVELNLGQYLSDFVLDKHNADSKLTFSISGKF